MKIDVVNRRWLILVAFGLVLLVAVMWRLQARGPTYQGKPAKYWLPQAFSSTAGEQQTALRAFREMGPAALPSLVAGLQKEDSQLSELYQKFYPRFPAALSRLLPRPVAAETIQSAASLVLMSNDYAKKAMPQIMSLLQSPNPAVRASSIQVVAAHAGPENEAWVPELVQSLKDPESRVRASASHGLGKIGPLAQSARQPLVDSLKDDIVRLSAAWSLWQITRQTNEVLPTLLGELNQGRLENRRWAAMCLSKMGAAGIEAVPTLIQWLSSADVHFRRSAAGYLGQYGPAAASAIPALVTAQKDPDQDVRASARWALKKIDPATTHKANEP